MDVDTSETEFRHTLVPLADSIKFNLVSALIIIVNAVLVGIEIENGRVNAAVQDRVPWYAELTEFAIQNIITVCFMIELSFRIHLHKRDFFRDFSNIFDVVCVLAAIVSTWFLAFLVPSDAANVYLVASTLRVIRVLTLGRLVRVFVVFKELWIVVSGFVEAIKTLLSVSALLVLVLYLCAVFVTVEIGQNAETYEPYRHVSGGWDYRAYFGSVGRSMFTLFQVMTLDDWSNGIARHVISNQPAMAVFFVLFIVLTSFGLMNVIVGIIVDRTLAAAKENQQRFQRTQERERTRVLNHLREIFDYADKDGNGSLTVDEFRSAIRQPEVERKLKLIELPVADAEELFAILDHDGSGELSVEEFIGGCIRLKGPAKSKDLLSVQVSIQALAERLETLEFQLSQSEASVQLLEAKSKAMLDEAKTIFAPGGTASSRSFSP